MRFEKGGAIYEEEESQGGHDVVPLGGNVLFQPEMERGRSPLVSIAPFGRGFSRHRYDHQAIPQYGCVPAEPASVSPGRIVV